MISLQTAHWSLPRMASCSSGIPLSCVIFVWDVVLRFIPILSELSQQNQRNHVYLVHSLQSFIHFFGLNNIITSELSEIVTAKLVKSSVHCTSILAMNFPSLIALMSSSIFVSPFVSVCLSNFQGIFDKTFAAFRELQSRILSCDSS